MNRYGKIIIAVFAGLMTVTACSVKERRSSCPCWLSIDIHNADTLHPDVLHRNITISEWGAGLIQKDTIDMEEYHEHPFYERFVPKGLVTVCAYAGDNEMETNGRKLIIPKGQQCDSLYAYRNIVDCNDDGARDSVVLHKQFSTVFFSMEHKDGETYPYAVRVRGNINGMDMTRLEPTSGEFVYEPQASGEFGNIFIFRVPRQKDNSLLVEILDGSLVLETVPIGEHVAKEGFSWSKTDLDDITIGMDFALAKVTINVIPWEKVIHEGNYRF